MDKRTITPCFTHYWVKGFGWENTIYGPEDFETVEDLGYNPVDGRVFLAFVWGRRYILKGHYV